MSLYTYMARLERVVDGDTYVLRVDCGFSISFTEKFRLNGANTPEKFGRNASDEGRTASEFVAALLRAQPEPFEIRTYKDKKGKYGRYLVDIILTHDENGELMPARSLSGYLITKDIAEAYKG